MAVLSSQPGLRRTHDGVVTVPAVAPPLERPVIFDQLWCDLAYLHWPVDPADVARFMPRGTRPDVVDGVTYVSLVPFRMRKAGPFRGLPVPWLGSFLEVNVRLYSVDDAGRHGVVFRSLDCDRAAVAAAAWAIRVPYAFSRIEAADYPATDDEPFPALPPGTRRWWTVRRHRGRASSRIAIRVGEPVEPTELEVFLSARWGMHSSFAGRTLWTPNEHGTWPLYAAELEELDDGLVAAAGIRPVGEMLRPLWSPGVHSLFGLPVRVRPGSAEREGGGGQPAVAVEGDELHLGRAG